MSRLGAALGSTGLAAVVIACNALTGASDLDTDPTAVGRGGVDGGDGSIAAADAARDANSGGKDAGSDAKLPCVPVTTPFVRGKASVTTTMTTAGVWTTPLFALNADAKTADLVFNVADKASPMLQVRDLSLNVPLSATLKGITVRVLRLGNVIQIKDDTARLLTSSPIGDSRASPTGWPTALTPREYGGVDDLWGTMLTPAMVNSGSFGFGISVIYPSGAIGGPIASVDEITIAVTYCP